MQYLAYEIVVNNVLHLQKDFTKVHEHDMWMLLEIYDLPERKHAINSSTFIFIVVWSYDVIW